MGIATLVLAVVIVAALIALGVPAWWRLCAFLPAWAGAIGYFQAREKT